MYFWRATGGSNLKRNNRATLLHLTNVPRKPLKLGNLLVWDFFLTTHANFQLGLNRIYTIDSVNEVFILENFITSLNVNYRD